jgi:deoxyribonucleoside regulator
MVNKAKLKLISKIAQLYYIENYMQRDIAEKLSISRVDVSRMITKAKKLGMVSIKINSSENVFGEMERKLENQYDLKECVIVSSFEKEANTFAEMAKYLSEILDRIVINDFKIGVSFGYSLGIISQHIELKKKENINVIPIIGSLGVIEEGINSNVIAKNFANAFGGISYIINSPAVLESIEAKKVMENDESNKKLFEVSMDLDIAIVGATDLGPQSSLYKFSNYKKEDFDYLSKLGVVGVVNLSSIDKEGNRIHNVVDERTIALPFERLRKTSTVILIAAGKRKKEIIKAALKSGVINIFMTDEDTAKSIISGN